MASQVSSTAGVAENPPSYPWQMGVSQWVIPPATIFNLPRAEEARFQTPPRELEPPGTQIESILNRALGPIDLDLEDLGIDEASSAAAGTESTEMDEVARGLAALRLSHNGYDILEYEEIPLLPFNPSAPPCVTTDDPTVRYREPSPVSRDPDNQTRGQRMSENERTVRSAPHATPGPAPRKKRNCQKLATFNMNGNANRKWMRMNQLMRDKRIAILAVQESHLTIETEAQIKALFNNRLHLMHSPDPERPSAKNGVAFVINKQYVPQWELAECITIIPGRAILLRINMLESGKMNILNVYAPSGNPNENAGFWREISQKTPTNTVIDVMLGDFNMVEESRDRSSGSLDPEETLTSLATIKEKHRLTDGWRSRHPLSLEYSHRATNGSMSRLDRIYVRNNDLHQMGEWETIESHLSDHKIIALSIHDRASPEIGHDKRTFPSFLLRNKKFTDDLIKKGLELQKMQVNTERSDINNIQTMWNDYKDWLMEHATNSAKKLFPFTLEGRMKALDKQ
jgi:exonuclease III